MTFRGTPQETETPATGPFGVPPEYLGPPDGETALRADEMHANRIEMQAMGALRSAIHDPNTGFASRPPAERLAALPEIQATLDGIGETFRAPATTPRQQAILAPLLDNHLEHAATQVGRLAHQALSEADDSIVETRIGNLQQDAAVNWEDPARLRILGRAVVTERRSQGERRGWDKAETETSVRQNLSDFYATAIEAAIDKDPDRAGKLLADAQGVLLPERQVLLARKLVEARDDKHVAGIAGALAALPLDPAILPNPEAYRARAEELTPDDALPELRARIAILADTAQRYATKYWQHDRNQAGLAAIDWMLACPGAPVVTMDRKVAARLSPEQLARLQEIETTGRLDTDPAVYDNLDRLAVYDPKAFAATDLSQYRLALDGQDYRRFTAFQRGDATFARYDRGRTVLDAGLIKAQLDPDGPEARAARSELGKTLRAFEAIEGRPPTMVDIDRMADAARRSNAGRARDDATLFSEDREGVPLRGDNGPDTLTTGNVEQAQSAPDVKSLKEVGDPGAALSHYLAGSGDPVQYRFDKIDTSIVKPSRFPAIKEILERRQPGSFEVDGKMLFSTTNSNARFLVGNISLSIKGKLVLDESGNYSFSGQLSADPDRYRFYSSNHRNSVDEITTKIGTLLPGRDFTVHITGEKPIEDAGKIKP